MVRTQIQLTEAQASALKRRAAQQGVSVAVLIRQAVDELVRNDDRVDDWERASRLIGRFRDSEGDVSANHDAYLDRIYR